MADSDAYLYDIFPDEAFPEEQWPSFGDNPSGLGILTEPGYITLASPHAYITIPTTRGYISI